ncbi:hypothetical protein KUCAC02_008421 [Chaenocephalus aceratus]|uniref:Uncharacterized protein n=1 Tax=Chaenocephalus aceratus TaxID=36190 RepID=A0ACB9X987_CHAAC|nr:hypothetical protein KUCAC02_008421 [Chaenocephalus aceratus]
MMQTGYTVKQFSNEPSLHHVSNKDSVPHITLLASGGGQRAAVGLVGSLYQMAKEDMLDTVLYLGGVSGSTWSMITIYSDPQWSTNMDAAVSQLSGPGVELKEALAWLGERAKEEHFSLTDIWGCHRDELLLKWAIEGKWFEVKPSCGRFHRVGSLHRTSLLGTNSREESCWNRSQKWTWSNFKDAIKDYLPPWLNVPGQVDGSTEEYMRTYNALVTLVAMTRSTIKDPTALSDLDKLQKILEETFNDKTWCQSREEGDFKTHVSLLTLQVIPKIMKWEWGTTANFLYQYQDSTVPPCLSTKERIHLVGRRAADQCGLPSISGRQERHRPHHCTRVQCWKYIETLIFARDYAAEVNKSFPEIDDKVLEEREWPKDCYVFEGKETELSIVYMPLFNRNNCKDAEEVKARMEEFSTFQRPFSQDKIEFVLNTAKNNMENNKDILLREINKAVLRRQNKR